MRLIPAFVLVAVLALPAVVAAQAAEVAQPAKPSASAAAAEPTPAVDASKLGVSLSRIRRVLGRQADENADALKLSFTVAVVGQAPKIDLLRDFPLSGAVPYGSPTHQEVLDVLTPQEFRSPVVPFSNLATWAASKLWDKSKRQRCEEELAAYKRMVMAGMAVAAPRCTQ